LAEGILKFHEEKKSWVNHPTENPEELALTSVRKENIPGTHIVTYVSDVDTLEIKHEAHNRLGFAEGAALAATWIVGKQGVFTMRDLLKFN
jgi:4-hydroxy-tetrahydrodipicolinate reductase